MRQRTYAFMLAIRLTASTSLSSGSDLRVRGRRLFDCAFGPRSPTVGLRLLRILRRGRSVVGDVTPFDVEHCVERRMSALAVTPGFDALRQ